MCHLNVREHQLVVTIEINNYAKDQRSNRLYMSISSIQAQRDKEDLHLYASDLTHSVKVNNYFLGSANQHLILIDKDKAQWIPLETATNKLSLVPFNQASDHPSGWSLSAERLTLHPAAVCRITDASRINANA